MGYGVSFLSSGATHCILVVRTRSREYVSFAAANRISQTPGFRLREPNEPRTGTRSRLTSLWWFRNMFGEQGTLLSSRVDSGRWRLASSIRVHWSRSLRPETLIVSFAPTFGRPDGMKRDLP